MSNILWIFCFNYISLALFIYIKPKADRLMHPILFTPKKADATGSTWHCHCCETCCFVLTVWSTCEGAHLQSIHYQTIEEISYISRPL